MNTQSPTIPILTQEGLLKIESPKNSGIPFDLNDFDVFELEDAANFADQMRIKKLEAALEERTRQTEILKILLEASLKGLLTHETLMQISPLSYLVESVLLLNDVDGKAIERHQPSVSQPRPGLVGELRRGEWQIRKKKKKLPTTKRKD
eukprot:TRINITY_DN5855_c0_g2_i2.p3 TRINITY_DN5855_c0_g2~~TRINITY_DN5855_c0_g2_i2.p3  ORF type:complete len:149 (-),score=24.70 TRINITY_DN5855_c0_g2_i2:200-646(-)